jgi:hypothetical protein
VRSTRRSSGDELEIIAAAIATFVSRAVMSQFA